ncbi:glycine cleavage system aminomethyltransferase GcvT [Cupriavidus neocaledonicus]|uniref:aminomethyltransferase n=1 Tax=Cupriavidus neocaledonicus TaxID=1040979 RepID=A0A375H8R8_9BURK|nr:glycine cleavage system aminomethyltransferase GcvT [Cupriavidus neocaledonicus]SOZ34781.1 Aminomethyltransferase [Cupriavidus neocaledonicus]SPD46853.1 Aminomethyltransferase [Cupriavidus neocaledonicus]
MTKSPPPWRSTPLYAQHLLLHARMGDVDGWMLPVAYGSQIEEHHAVRRHAGMFDLSHLCVADLLGPDARMLLGRLLSNDVGKLKTPGKALYSCMLDTSGGVIDDLVVYYLGPQHYRAVLNARTAVGDIAWIHATIHEARAEVTVVPRRPDCVTAGIEPLAVIAVQGPRAREKVLRALPAARRAQTLKPFNSTVVHDDEAGELMVARTGKTGEDGFELMVPAAHAGRIWDRLHAAGSVAAGHAAWDTLRLEAGVHRYGQDMDVHTSPLDAGLGWSVDLDSGRDFCGRAAVRARGQTQQFVGLALEGSAAVPPAHSTVTSEAGAVIGKVTSATYSPTLGFAIALARVAPGVRIGAPVKVEVYRNRIAATVVRTPFVRGAS